MGEKNKYFWFNCYYDRNIHGGRELAEMSSIPGLLTGGVHFEKSLGNN